MKELKGYLEQARSVLGKRLTRNSRLALETLAYMTDLVGSKDMTIEALAADHFGASTRRRATCWTSNRRGSRLRQKKDEEKSVAEDTKPETMAARAGDYRRPKSQGGT
jgi:hypothetical protein